MATALVILEFPFSDTGNTTDNLDDYSADCPYTGSTSPDVVYSFTPDADQQITIDLCGSTYDTKTFVMNSDLEILACNDDAYFQGNPCGTYVSAIEDFSVLG